MGQALKVKAHFVVAAALAAAVAAGCFVCYLYNEIERRKENS